MSVDYTKIYKFDDSYEIEIKENKYLYINYNDVNWFRTNNTGKELIARCDGTKTIEQIIEELALEKKFSFETLKTVFEEYFENLVNSGVIYDVDLDKPFKERPVDTKGGTWDAISDLWIHVSGKCNLACPFCYSLSGESNDKRLDYKKILNFLSGIEEEKRNSIVISGGEPFLYEGLVTLVKGLKDLKYKSILIITNGTAGEEKYEEVLPYVNGIQVSVDGSNAKIHDISRGTGSYAKMVKNLALLKKLDVNRLIISFTPTEKNIDDLSNIPVFAYDNKVDAIHITRLMPVGRAKGMTEPLTMDSKSFSQNFTNFINNFNHINEVITIENEISDTCRSLISLTFAGDQTYKVAYRQKKITCGAGLGSMSIYFDGNIYPCASLQNSAFIFGTIDDNVNDVIQNAKKFMTDVSVERLPECRECKFKYMCGGGCRACAYAFSGNEDIYAKDPMCERYKKEMMEIIWKLDCSVSNQSYFSENPLGK